MRKLRRILIIDDNEVTTLYRRKLLNNLYPEIDVFVAENGKVGLDFFVESTEKPHLIFLDLHMPVMNGFEFLKKLSSYLSEEDKALVKVVISSASEGDSDMQAAEKLYSNISYCPKPVLKESVIAIIEGLERGEWIL